MALAAGLAAMGLLQVISPAWLKAAGGLFVVATVVAIALQLLGVL